MAVNVLQDFIELEQVVEFAQLIISTTKTYNNVLPLNARIMKFGGEENASAPLDTTLLMENVEDVKTQKIMIAPLKLADHLVEQIKYGWEINVYVLEAFT